MLSLCTAIAEQDANKGAAGADKGAYGDVRVRSRWGKELRKQIDRDGRHAFAPSFAELLQEEDLHRASPDCERVVQRWRRM